MPDFLARFAVHGGTARAIGITALLLTVVAIPILRRRANAVGRIARVLLLDVLIVVGLLTLLPASGGGQAVNLIPGRGVSALETAANVALFVPAGALLRLAVGRRLGAFAALGLVVPVVIELLQFFLHLGRIADINDVLANALGACAGFLVMGVLTFRPGSETRSHLHLWPPSAS